MKVTLNKNIKGTVSINGQEIINSDDCLVYEKVEEEKMYLYISDSKRNSIKISLEKINEIESENLESIIDNENE